MDSEEYIVVDLDACTSNKQSTTTTDKKGKSKGAVKSSSFEKALAYRALYGSHNSRSKSRNVTNYGTRLSPSRLSKVSLADDSVS
ncbi:hypothetical protein M5689_005408 [Euphorbia peplus]|nr:hypothetical protein M5689_005408 [Euphorbia peplus]